jgi:hypothetical protein
MDNPGSNSGRVKRNSLLQNIQIVPRAHPDSFSSETVVLYRGKANGT